MRQEALEAEEKPNRHHHHRVVGLHHIFILREGVRKSGGHRVRRSERMMYGVTCSMSLTCNTTLRARLRITVRLTRGSLRNKDTPNPTNTTTSSNLARAILTHLDPGSYKSAAPAFDVCILVGTFGVALRKKKQRSIRRVILLGDSLGGAPGERAVAPQSRGAEDGMRQGLKHGRRNVRTLAEGISTERKDGCGGGLVLRGDARLAAG